MKKLNELSNEELVNVLKEAQKELEKRKNEWPQVGNKYWVIESTGNIFGFRYGGNSIDSKYKQLGNMFKTKEDAENTKKLLNLELQYKIARWIVENDKEALELDWEDGFVEKWHIFYHNSVEKFKVWWSYSAKYTGSLYFSSKDKAEQCIKDLGLNDID